MPQPKTMRILSVRDTETGEVRYCLPMLLGETLADMGISRDELGFESITRNVVAGWFSSGDISYVQVYSEDLRINV